MKHAFDFENIYLYKKLRKATLEAKSSPNIKKRGQSPKTDEIKNIYNMLCCHVV